MVAPWARTSPATNADSSEALTSPVRSSVTVATLRSLASSPVPFCPPPCTSTRATSSAGAIGYGQFLPSTWAAYGNGGDPYDYRDAIPAMARYLCDHGGAQDLRKAVYAYNHADWYVNEVLAIAAR